MLNLLPILTLCLIYGYLNGLHSSASLTATMISSRAASPRMALFLATMGVALGPFVLGVAVANTIGTQLVRVDATTVQIVIAALLGAIGWGGLMLWFKLPISISQALVGSLIGAVLVGFGAGAVMMPGLLKIILALFVSPLLGILVGFLLVRLVYRLGITAPPSINRWLNRGQLLFSLLLAMFFGANDGQKIMGMVMLGLIATGLRHDFVVPLWVVGFSALAISIGSFVGGWRLMQTLGRGLYTIRPVHGFGTQAASAGILFFASVLGGPVSGSQVITSAIVGAGSADRVQKVRWGAVQHILTSWLLTIPLSAVLGGLVYWVIRGLA